eukprot:5957280-Pyramimonas_sp.AAC.1
MERVSFPIERLTGAFSDRASEFAPFAPYLPRVGRVHHQPRHRRKHLCPEVHLLSLPRVAQQATGPSRVEERGGAVSVKLDHRAVEVGGVCRARRDHSAVHHHVVRPQRHLREN